LHGCGGDLFEFESQSDFSDIGAARALETGNLKFDFFNFGVAEAATA
jgi:hypothetical protein